jgi:hypothetical protein
MDYSESVDIKLEPYLRRQIVEIKNNFKKELLEPKVIDLYNGNNYYDLFLEGLKPLEINSTKRNHLCNVYTSLHKRLFTYKGGDYVYGNDIESYIWSLLSYYYDPAKDGDFSKYMSFSKNFKEWTSLRLDPNNIKIPILRDAMIEIRKDFDITVPELCKRLKLNCEFL